MLRRHTRELAVVALSMLVGFIVVSGRPLPTRSQAPPSIEHLRSIFAQPTSVPHPPDNPPTPAKIALGARLFSDTVLSGNGRIACATCHNPMLAFADGSPISRAGATGTPLRRHTPALWNLAWAPALTWDGRAQSLEDQARIPMSHPDEMASTPEAAAERLHRDGTYATAFKAAFADGDRVTAAQLLAALASYERSLVSPPTRFDRWVAGDDHALEPVPRRGLALFAGKAQCINCHTGFAFTDYAFHDIGLPGHDRGRGAITGIAAVDRAFKTPTLRELAWTAPYMHDGTIATLEDVVRHYEAGGLQRPSRSRDMPRPFRLTDDERADLVVFLESLSSDLPPKPSAEAWVGRPAPVPQLVPLSNSAISQRDRQFTPAAVRVPRGRTITILNDDTRPHNVTINERKLRFNSGAQEPGESIALKLDESGLFEAHCAIHPTMRLRIEVE